MVWLCQKRYICAYAIVALIVVGTLCLLAFALLVVAMTIKINLKVTLFALIYVACLYTPLFVYGQARVDKGVTIMCISESPEMRGATYWRYDETLRKWDSVGCWSSIKTKTIKVSDSTYYAIYVENHGTNDEYPYKPYTETKVFVFPYSEYSKLYSISDRAEIFTHIYYHSENTLSSEQELLFWGRLQTEIEQYENYRVSPTKYVFRVIKSAEGKLRFTLPEEDREVYSEFERGALEKWYYEVSVEDFSKFLLR